MTDNARAQMKWNGEKVKITVREAVADALYEGAEHILTESGKLVPHDVGMLQISGDVNVDAEDLQASIYYDTPYAVRQHEDPLLSHPNGRQWKYLETPLYREMDAVQKFMVKYIKKALR